MSWLLRNLIVSAHGETGLILLSLSLSVNLVNKDQLDILATLRESVEGDKVELKSGMEKLRQQVKELSDKNKMQLEQINGLLMEKVTLQSEGIGQRERCWKGRRISG